MRRAFQVYVHKHVHVHVNVSNPIRYIAFSTSAQSRSIPPDPDPATGRTAIRDNNFYDEEGRIHRRYYYVLDSRGNLFLESSKFRNMATSLKDVQFLDFLYRMMKPNQTSLYPDIPYISLCGKEVNYIRPEDPKAAIVFSALIGVENSSSSSEDNDNIKPAQIEMQLEEVGLTVGASSLKQPFSPNMLSYCQESGRLYHSIASELPIKHLAKAAAPGKTGAFLGLLHPQICQSIVMSGLLKLTTSSSSIEDQGGENSTLGNNVTASIVWKNKNYIVKII